MEIGHRRGFNGTGHDTVNGDVLFILQNRTYSLDLLMECGLSSTVLRAGCARINPDHAARHDDLAACPTRVIPYEVHRECSSVYYVLKIGVGRVGVWLCR